MILQQIFPAEIQTFFGGQEFQQEIAGIQQEVQQDSSKILQHF